MAEKKKQKGKKGIMGIITIILVPILILVLLASFFFSIINGIINLIKNLIGRFIRAIIDLFKNPVQWLKNRWAELSNWFDREIGGNEKFDPESYETEGRVDPTMVIGIETFENMKTDLDAIINRNTAGLDDIMLKKMLLTYYRGIYLDDTTILIELTKEDLNIDEEKWVDLFTYKVEKDKKDLMTNIGANVVAGAAVGGMIGHGPGAIVRFNSGTNYRNIWNT